MTSEVQSKVEGWLDVVKALVDGVNSRGIDLSTVPEAMLKAATSFYIGSNHESGSRDNAQDGEIRNGTGQITKKGDVKKSDPGVKKPWVKHSVAIDGVWYSTFKWKDVAGGKTFNEGDHVDFTAEKSGDFWNLTKIAAAAGSVQAPDDNDIPF